MVADGLIASRGAVCGHRHLTYKEALAKDMKQQVRKSNAGEKKRRNMNVKNTNVFAGTNCMH